jgi:signal recognition particle subunit SRP54
MLDSLSKRLQDTLSQVGQAKQLTLENMEEALKEVRRALLEADVSLRVVKAFLTRIKERAEGQDILKHVNPSQQLVKCVHDELVNLLGGENQPLVLDKTPSIILMFGLQGSGKTTTSAKLAKQLLKQGKSPLLIAADVYRPAAIQQLLTLGERAGVPVYAEQNNTDVVSIVKAGLAQNKTHDVVIIDTAGRLQADTEMMAELLLLERLLQPQEKLLVIDAMTGQEALTVAETFHEQLGMTGLVLTKLDGDTRGGAALSVVEVTGQPIKLIGVGEDLDGLEVFYPDRLASRILGMGDVVSLVERAKAAINEEEALEMAQKMRKNSFNLNDFLTIQKTLGRLGPLDQILGMLPIPGLTQDMKDMVSHQGQGQLKRVESMIKSMTPAERDQPSLINVSRKKRIARGCGMPEAEITQFLKSFEMMKTVMGQMSQMGMPGLGGRKMPALPAGFKLRKGGLPGQKKAKKPNPFHF